MASATTATGLAVPTGGDPHDPQGDIVELAVSLRTGTIVPAANQAARHAIGDRLVANGTPATATTPLFVWQSDTETLWLNNGKVWRASSAWSTPAVALRQIDATFNPGGWVPLSPALPHQFLAGSWYEVIGRGNYGTGGAAANVSSRILATGISASPELPARVAPDIPHRIDDIWTFQATATATVDVVHQLYVDAPATGLIVYTGASIAIKRIA